jgi:hypothetical protein
VEKDFWATEALRAVTVYADSVGAPAIFKGGTSLSKAWKLTERFSEDVDLVLDFPTDMGNGQRERILKGIPAAVDGHLRLGPDTYRSANQKKGVARNVFIAYPVVHPAASAEVKEEVLLEVGSRGAPTPNEEVDIVSFVAEHLLAKGSTADDFEELAPVRARVLVPERTLVEKIALLANRDSRFRGGETTVFEGLGRHLYDVHALFTDEHVLRSLMALGDDGRRAVAADVHERSVAAKWPSVEQPPAGWIATSECFTPGTASADALAQAYTRAAQMIYGDAPAFGRCLAIVQEHVGVL